jgi:hypothetical protein
MSRKVVLLSPWNWIILVYSSIYIIPQVSIRESHLSGQHFELSFFYVRIQSSSQMYTPTPASAEHDEDFSVRYKKWCPSCRAIDQNVTPRKTLFSWGE